MKTKISLLMLLLSLTFIKTNAQRLHFDTNAITQNSTSCTVCNGSAIDPLMGGFPPYTYYWSNLRTFSGNDTDFGLCAGNYYVIGYDSHGDSTTGYFTIYGPSRLFDTMYSTNATCSSSIGTALISVGGGSQPYTYSWSNGATTSSISGLSAGTYSVSVIDSGGCSIADSVSVSGSLVIFLSDTNVLCNGNNTGWAMVDAVTGGVTPYTYLWMPGGGTNVSISGLSAGTYTITATDNNGCTGTSLVFITQPPLLQIDTNIIITGANCSNNNGSAQIHVSGGTPSYRYNWSPTGGTNALASNLSAGTYTVVVNDNNGCSVSDSIVVPNIGVVPTISTVNDSCYGESNGIASVIAVTGGTSPYTYDWIPTGGTNSSITGLSAGNYSVVVTDNTGCSGTTPVAIYQPGQITFYVDTIPDTGSCSGSAMVIISGGTGPYTYSWSTNVNNVIDSGYDYADSMCAGAYLVCVTDAHGCSNCDSVHIRHAAHNIAGIATISGSMNDIRIYPVPVSASLIVQTGNMQSGNYNLSVYDLIGREVISNPGVYFSPGKLIPVDVSQIPSGKYILRIYNDSLNKTAPFIVVH